MTVEITPLGTWGRAGLLAEYDPESDTIRIDAVAVETIRGRLGAVEAEGFVTVAIAHERYHRANPGASEALAHAHARATTGRDPERYECILRDARSAVR